jgi:hypothetical protein
VIIRTVVQFSILPSGRYEQLFGCRRKAPSDVRVFSF